ncbi:MAG TPA: histidinol-phosphate transaminase [Dehalococcoidales bacterium]|nr:histidinol-phosphate transaminase [Dehalococcoidales bacterium]
MEPKKYLLNLQKCAHGGINFAEFKELGIDPDNILDFSVSTNPFMPPPGLKETLWDIPVERYPDSRCLKLTGLLADRLKIATENIIVGSGTTELIRLIALAYFRKGDNVGILGPTYGEYETACRMHGARVISCRALEKNDFQPDIKAVTGAIQKRRPRAVFICNPNNPTGKYLTRREIESILEAGEDTLLVLDDAYATFVQKAWNSLDLIKKQNVIILRSMTKDYGLPGLRLGYALANPDIIAILRAVLPPWSVNIVAQEFGAACLKQDKYLFETLQKIRASKEYLIKAFGQLGFSVVPSDAHYFLVKVGDAAACRRTLLKRDIQVRDCTSFGLPEFIRISPRSLPDCEKLIMTIKKEVK